MGTPRPLPEPEPDVVGPHGVPFPTLPPRGGARYRIGGVKRRMSIQPQQEPRATNAPTFTPSSQ